MSPTLLMIDEALQMFIIALFFLEKGNKHHYN